MGISVLSCQPMVWDSSPFMLWCCQQWVWPCSPFLCSPLPPLVVFLYCLLIHCTTGDYLAPARPQFCLENLSSFKMAETMQENCHLLSTNLLTRGPWDKQSSGRAQNEKNLRDSIDYGDPFKKIITKFSSKPLYLLINMKNKCM